METARVITTQVSTQLLLDDSVRLAEDRRYEESFLVLDQTHRLVHCDATPHFRKAIIACAATRQLLVAGSDPTVQRFGATNHVVMNPIVRREIEAGEAKKSTTDKEQYKKFRQRARFAMRTVEALLDIHRSEMATTVDGLGLPMTAAFIQMQSPDDEMHYEAFKALATTLQPFYPAQDEVQSDAHADAHAGDVVQSCIAISRMQGGLQKLIDLVNSKYEQKQWTAAVILCRILESDVGCHSAFISMGGIQALRDVLLTHSSPNQIQALRGLRHLAMAEVLAIAGKSVIVTMFDAGTIEAVIRLLSTPGNEDSQADACDLLRAMSENLVEMVEKIFMAEGIEAFIVVLEYRNAQLQRRQLSDVLVAQTRREEPSTHERTAMKRGRASQAIDIEVPSDSSTYVLEPGGDTVSVAIPIATC